MTAASNSDARKRKEYGAFKGDDEADSLDPFFDAADVERHKDALFDRGERWKARCEKAEKRAANADALAAKLARVEALADALDENALRLWQSAGHAFVNSAAVGAADQASRIAQRVRDALRGGAS